MLEIFGTFKSRSKRGLAYPNVELLELFGSTPNAAGVPVNAIAALRSTTFLAGARAIAEAVGILPVHLFRRTGSDRDRVSSGPAATLLAGDWNPWQGSTEARTAMQLDAICHGFGIAQLVRVAGQPRELHRLDPTTITVDQDGSTLEPLFRMRTKDGGERTLSFQDVLFVPTPGWTIDRPLCLLSKCKDAVGIDLAMAERQARFLGTAVSTGGKLRVPEGVGAEKAKELITDFIKAHGGSRKAGGIVPTWGGLEFEEAEPFHFADSQFLELRKFVVAEIARALKVPPVLVGDLDRATWRNVEELAQVFLNHTLLPWLEVWKSALERTLLAPEQRADHFIEFKVEDLLRADVASRFVAYRNAIGGAWLTPNEGRKLENLPPVEGGDELIRQAGQEGAASSTPDDQRAAA